MVQLGSSLALFQLLGKMSVLNFFLCGLFVFTAFFASTRAQPLGNWFATPNLVITGTPYNSQVLVSLELILTNSSFVLLANFTSSIQSCPGVLSLVNLTGVWGISEDNKLTFGIPTFNCFQYPSSCSIATAFCNFVVPAFTGIFPYSVAGPLNGNCYLTLANWPDIGTTYTISLTQATAGTCPITLGTTTDVSDVLGGTGITVAKSGAVRTVSVTPVVSAGSCTMCSLGWNAEGQVISSGTGGTPVTSLVTTSELIASASTGAVSLSGNGASGSCVYCSLTTVNGVVTVEASGAAPLLSATCTAPLVCTAGQNPTFSLNSASCYGYQCQMNNTDAISNCGGYQCQLNNNDAGGGANCDGYSCQLNNTGSGANCNGFACQLGNTGLRAGCSGYVCQYNNSGSFAGCAGYQCQINNVATQTGCIGFSCQANNVGIFSDCVGSECQLNNAGVHTACVGDLCLYSNTFNYCYGIGGSGGSAGTGVACTAANQFVAGTAAHPLAYIVYSGISVLSNTAASSSGVCLGTASDTCMWRGAAGVWNDNGARWINTYACVGCSAAPTAIETGAMSAKHFYGTSGTPTCVLGTGAQGAGTGTCTIVATDMGGTIQVLTAGVPALSAVVATVTFATAWTTAPKGILLAPSNTAAALLSGASSVYISSAATTTAVFTLNSLTTPLVTGTTYIWTFGVRG